MPVGAAGSGKVDISTDSLGNKDFSVRPRLEEGALDAARGILVGMGVSCFLWAGIIILIRVL